MRRLADFVVRWPWAVIAIWIALAAALPLTVPSLGEMAQKHPLAILPADAPSSVAAQKMTDAFHESTNDNLMVVVLINEQGLQRSDEATYKKLVDALHDDMRDVVMVQDFLTTRELRTFLTSEDNKAWVVPVGMAGELGTPGAFDAFNRVSEIVNRAVAGTSMEVHITGPAATVADLTVAGDRDRMPIELAIGILVLAVLLLVYRNVVTMMLPLVTIGASLVIAQALVSDDQKRGYLDELKAEYERVRAQFRFEVGEFVIHGSERRSIAGEARRGRSDSARRSCARENGPCCA